MVDHEAIINAMNTKQVLLNLESNHPIKEILNTQIKDINSYFNSKMLKELDGPGKIIKTR